MQSYLVPPLNGVFKAGGVALGLVVVALAGGGHRQVGLGGSLLLAASVMGLFVSVAAIRLRYRVLRSPDELRVGRGPMRRSVLLHRREIQSFELERRGALFLGVVKTDGGRVVMHGIAGRGRLRLNVEAALSELTTWLELPGGAHPDDT